MGSGELIVGNNSGPKVLALKEKAPQDRVALNQTTNDWHTKSVTLSETKGLAVRPVLSEVEGFFATLLMNKSVVRTAHATALFLRGSISAPRAMGYSE